MSFRDFLIEDAGNLKGLPATWLKHLTSQGSLAGRKSDIILYKKNIKGKDISAATKMVAGFIPDNNNYNYNARNGQDKKDAQTKAANYAGVILKTGGEFTHYIEFTEYGAGAANRQYSLISRTGFETQKLKRQISQGRNMGKRSYWHDTVYLTATEIKSRLNLDDYDYDLYLVTTDESRIKKRKERSENTSYTREKSKGKLEALEKFLNKKSGEILSDYKKEIHSELDNILSKVNTAISSDINNSNIDFDSIDKSFDDIKQLTKDLYELRISMSNVIKDGGISNIYAWSNEKTTRNYRIFKSHIESIKNKIDEK